MKSLLIQEQSSGVKENMSNLTCAASGEFSVSSGNNRAQTEQYFAPPTQIHPQPSVKRKRNQTGNPDPEAEVISLSPKTLMATNRFVCEICNKGFQRDQNLQLHRRGHNLPWKLKQRENKEVMKKKVYVCPEATCVHHDPSRALGDLTGIKKHFCRKHGEKKWKCEKCEKRYAVKSDWKAHSKICGTREYRCDCGTIFSRRDSFITHRAFCDALAEESERVITATPLLSSQPLTSSPTSSLHILNNNLLQLQPQFHSHDLHPFPMKKYQHSFNLRPSENIPPWPPCPPVIGVGPGPPPQPQPPIDLSSSIFSTSIDNHGENPSPNPSLGPTILQPYHHHPSASSSSSSATALLQKVSRMGASMITPFGNVSPAATAGAGTGAPSSLLQEMMASLSSATGFVGSEGGGDGVNEGLTFSWV